ncbi:MAG TPA: hypothetical protein VFS60_05875 [Thermoanaerobaculia bacterium]|nr:hypothetical protein [Thermoanaerobaculia bacterium]
MSSLDHPTIADGAAPTATAAVGPPEAAFGLRARLPRAAVELALLSFTALFLELMVIRWVPAVVRIVSYYANLMLISSFLGLGIGALLARHRRDLFPWLTLGLLGDVLLLLACRSVLLPGSDVELRFAAGGSNLPAYATLVTIFVGNTLLFAPLGQRIGRAFAALGNLRAYAWDLGGSLAGTVAFALFAYWHFSPLLGMAAVVTIAIALGERRRRGWQALPALAVLVVVFMATPRRAIWSPYHYVTLHDEGGQLVVAPPPGLAAMRDPPLYVLRVNQDFYQLHGSIDLRRYSPGSPRFRRVASLRAQYLLPYAAGPHPQRVLVVGAGGGPDVEAALLSGATRVDAVDIDPAILALARRFNAARVYDDRRVRVHVDDARSFLERARHRYDAVVFGFLDSQGLSSSMANIRLDGFVYTVESFHSAFSLVEPGGVLSVAFYPGARPWLVEKLAGMLQRACGKPPAVYSDGSRVILLATRPGPQPRALPAGLGAYRRVPPPAGAVPPAVDDWPYLYLAQRTIPTDYLVVLVVLLGLSLAALRLLAPAGFGGRPLHFVCLGAAFLLLETKSIVDCSLYFGSTWLVTLLVVCGVLLMVLAANAVAMRARGLSARALYAPLLLSMLLLYLAPRAPILALPWGARLLWTLLVVPLPIFFAGLIFSTSFRDQPNAPALLGANLVGAMVGGFGEYLGMAIGYRALSLLAMAFYLGSLLCLGRGGEKSVAAPRAAP